MRKRKTSRHFDNDGHKHSRRRYPEAPRALYLGGPLHGQTLPTPDLPPTLTYDNTDDWVNHPTVGAPLYLYTRGQMADVDGHVFPIYTATPGDEEKNCTVRSLLHDQPPTPYPKRPQPPKRKHPDDNS